MKSRSGIDGVRWGRVGGWVRFALKVMFLVAGYGLLSPDNCRRAAAWLWRSIPPLAGWLDFWGWTPVQFAETMGRVVPPAVLAGAAVCVLGLFLAWRWEWLWLGLAMAGGAAWGIWGMPGPWWAWWHGLDALYAGVCLILFAGWLASALYRQMKSGGAQALALLGLVAAGCLLYEALEYKGVVELRGERWVRPAQVIDQVFGVLDKPKDDEALRALPGWLADLYFLFHAVLWFFGGFVVVGAVSRPLVNAMLLRFMRTPDCVFWGVSPEALALAKSLSRKRKGKRSLSCVFAVEEVSAEPERELQRGGFLWVVEGRREPSVAVRRARRHFFLTEDGSANVAGAERLAKVARGEPETWVRIDDEADDSWLHQWADGEDIRKSLEVHIVRETSLAADILLGMHPMLKAPGIRCEAGRAVEKTEGDKDAEGIGRPAVFRLLLVGFGWQGRMLLNRTISDAQAPGTSFGADIIDLNAAAMESYRRRNPDAVREYHLEFHALDATGGEFYGWLDRLLEDWPAFTRMVVATGNDALNLDVATHIDLRLRERGDVKWAREAPQRLFVRVRHPEKFAGLGKKEKRPFTAFGALEEIYAREALLDSEEDRIARVMNARWAAKGKRKPTVGEVRQSWREASFFNRESSRASAMGVWNLWRLSGCAEKEAQEEAARRQERESLKKAGEKAPCEKPETPEERQERREKEWDAALAADPGLALRLADAEHLRWMAFHYVRGVRRWDVKAQPDLWKTAGKVKANLREAANRHAALVPSAELPLLEWRLEEMYWRARGGAPAVSAQESREAAALRAWYGKYAEEAGHVASAMSTGGAVPAYDANLPLWYRNKGIRVAERWQERFCGGEGKAWEAARAATFHVLKDFLERIWAENPPTPSAESCGIAEWRKAAEKGGLGIWLLARNPVWSRKSRHALRALKAFPQEVEKLFGKGRGKGFEPDKRFRTPGDMVDNDLRVVASVPEYLSDSGGLA